MGKKNSAGRRPNLPSPSHPPQSTADSLGIIKSLCDKVFNSLHGGEIPPPKLVKQLEESLSDHPSSADLHSAKASLYFKLYTVTSASSSFKLKYLKTANLSAQEALSLSSNTPTNHLLYNQIQFELAKKPDEFKKIVQQCEKALLIENPPVDVKEKIVELTEKAKMGSLITTGGKNVDEKKRMIDGFLKSKQDFSMKKIEDAEFRKTQKLKLLQIEIKIESLRMKEEKLGAGYAVDGNEVDERKKSSFTNRFFEKLNKKDRVNKYWKEMTWEEKRGLLNVKVDDIREYYSKHGKSGAMVFMNAINFVRNTKEWKFWECCHCGSDTWSTEWDEIRQHVNSKHIGDLEEKHKDVLPSEDGDIDVKKIGNGALKPVDVDKMVEKCKGYKDDGDSDRAKIDERDWIFCDDVERQEMLDLIQEELQLFLRKMPYLAPHIGSWMVGYATNELRNLVPGLQDLIPSLEKTPLCICFSGVEQLMKVYDFLVDLSIDCGLESSSSDDEGDSKEKFHDDKSFCFDSDYSCLILDDRFFRWKSDAAKQINTTADKGTAVISAGEVPEEDRSSDNENFVDWLFTGDESRALIKSWINLRVSKTEQAKETISFVETEFRKILDLCERKCMLLDYQNAFMAVERICLEERKRRIEISDYKAQSLLSLLFERQDELFKLPSDIMEHEFACIWNILSAQDAAGCANFRLDETLFGANTQLPDLEGHEDRKHMEPDTVVDDSAEEAMKMEKANVAIEFCKYDALIMKSANSTNCGERELELVSACDYRVLLLHLVKLFIRAHLEDLADKAAANKACAAEAISAPADLALEPSKNMTKGSSNSRKKQKKPKHRNDKGQEKTVDKDTGGSKKHLPLGKENKVSFPVASDGGCSGSAINVSLSTDDLEQQGEDLTRNIDYENLDGTVDGQRHVENDAKQNQLVDKNKKTDGTIAENDGKEVPLVCPDFCEGDDLSVHELQEYSETETFRWKEMYFGKIKCPILDDLRQVSGRSCRPCNPDVGEIAKRDELNLMPADPPAVEIKKLENLMAFQEDSAGWITFPRPETREKRSQSFGKVKQGSSLQSVPKDSAPPNNQQKHSLKSVNQNCRTFLTREVKDDAVASEIVGQNEMNFLYQNKIQDVYRVQKTVSVETEQKLPQTLFSKEEGPRKSLAGLKVDDVDGSEVIGAGLKNDIGKNYSSLNVIIQSLWHIRQFRIDLISEVVHKHFGHPCVVCKLAETFSALSEASGGEIVSPTSLSIAVSKFSSHDDPFMEEQMNDASKVLQTILDFLHLSVTGILDLSFSVSEKCCCLQSWICRSNACLAHKFFGMDLSKRVDCNRCGLELLQQKNTYFFHTIKASKLREKVSTPIRYGTSSFHKLLKLMLMNYHLACDLDTDGCGESHIKYILQTPPPVFTIVLDWKSERVSPNDIKETLAVIATEIDIGILYQWLQQEKKYRLVSVVCYRELHYLCFIYSHKHEKWTKYDDTLVQVIGSWNELINICHKKCFQPQILFFEAVLPNEVQNQSLELVDHTSETSLTGKNSDESGTFQRDGGNKVEILDQDKSQDACGVQNNVAFGPEEKLPEKSSTDFKVDCMDDYDIFNAVLENDGSKNHSSLNSLWHMPEFQDCLIKSVHQHVIDPCVASGLAETFAALSGAFQKVGKDIVSATSLSIAINLYSQADLFQKGQMNDAARVLEIIFDSLHESFAGIFDFSISESEKRDFPGSWDCTSNICLSHRLFGMNIFKRVNCEHCGLESRKQKCTPYFHFIETSELRETKRKSGTCSFDEQLKLMRLNYYVACDPDSNGCGERNHVTYILAALPNVLIIVLMGLTNWETRENVRETLTSLGTELDAGVLYKGLEQGNGYHLVSMACYRGLHYLCFVYSQKLEKWMKYDDTNVEVVGSWNELLDMCIKEHLQPQILFFEAAVPNDWQNQPFQSVDHTCKILPTGEDTNKSGAMHVNNRVEILDQDKNQDTYRAQQNASPDSDKRLPHKFLLIGDEPWESMTKSKASKVDGSGIFGAGLRNEGNENNCFLNVIIQCLWHLQLFRNELTSSQHCCIERPCIVCGLATIFGELTAATTSTCSEVISPTSLRNAISTLCASDRRFQEGERHDADELLKYILEKLHDCFTIGLDVSKSECKTDACLAHTLFGLHISERVNCDPCPNPVMQTSTQFSHMIYATLVRETKKQNQASSFSELLEIMQMENWSTCKSDEGGCGKRGSVQFILRTPPPPIFVLHLTVRPSSETSKTIRETLSALDTELDISLLYKGLRPGNKYRLISVVCISGAHYVCFCYRHDHKKWIMCNDAIVEAIGSWNDVSDRCVKDRWLPLILFFEAAQ